MADVEGVNEQLQHTILKLNTQLTILQREKEELANEVATANAIVCSPIHLLYIRYHQFDLFRLMGTKRTLKRNAVTELG